MASSSAEKKKHVLMRKVLPKLKIGSSERAAKKKKKTEIQLEAASVSRNFDPETYVIPLQNKWTFESHVKRSKAYENQQTNNLSTTSGFSENFLNDASSNDQSYLQSSDEREKYILQNEATEEIAKKKAQKIPSRERKNRSNNARKALTKLDSIGYVPSHPNQRQRSRHSSSPDNLEANGRINGLSDNNNIDQDDGNDGDYIVGGDRRRSSKKKNRVLRRSILSQIEEQRQSLIRRAHISGWLVDQRFGRLESHVITLARSVANLSAELKVQNKMRQNISNLQKEFYDLSMRRNNEVKYLQEKVRLVQIDKMTQKRIRKLRHFFGEDPSQPLLLKFLKQLGYEEYSPLFHKGRIGLMELPYLSEEQLIELGLPLGPASRIIENAKHVN
eukprot:gene20290-22276_t